MFFVISQHGQANKGSLPSEVGAKLKAEQNEAEEDDTEVLCGLKC